MANATAADTPSVSGLPDKNETGLPEAPRLRGRTFAILKRVALWALGLSAAFVAIMGLLHTKMAAPLLAATGVSCPVRPLSPEEVDRGRSFAATQYAGKPAAPARPALGFAFDKTTIDDVEAWAKKFDVTCKKINGSETLRSCDEVPAAALGQPESFGPAEVSFQFRASRTLTNVTVFRRRLSVEQAVANTAELTRRLRADLGEPAVRGGQNTPENFNQPGLQAFKEEWLFGDYGVAVGAARLGNKGIASSETYLSPLP